MPWCKCRRTCWRRSGLASSQRRRPTLPTVWTGMTAGQGAYMTVRSAEQQLGDLRWIVLRGPADEAFCALGAAEGTQIREVLTDWPMMAQLRRHVAGPAGSQALAAVRRASE